MVVHRGSSVATVIVMSDSSLNVRAASEPDGEGLLFEHKLIAVWVETADQQIPDRPCSLSGISPARPSSLSGFRNHGVCARSIAPVASGAIPQRLLAAAYAPRSRHCSKPNDELTHLSQARCP
jgi:hypothetical protein